MGSFVTSYGNDCEMDAATVEVTEVREERTEMQTKIDGRLSGRNVKDGYGNYGSHDGDP